jgi:hypothetical protein
MAWLFNSKGEPIAYVTQNYANKREAYSIWGGYLGKMDGDEIWNRSYKGEVVDGNRLFIRLSLKHVIRERNLEQERTILNNNDRPTTPENQTIVTLPSDFEDFDFFNQPTIDEDWSHILSHNDKFYAVFLRHPRIDVVTALECLVSILQGEQPTFNIQYTECYTHKEAESALKELESPTAPELSKEHQELFDKPVLPYLFSGVMIAMAVLGGLSILQMLLHPN